VKSAVPHLSQQIIPSPPNSEGDGGNSLESTRRIRVDEILLLLGVSRSTLYHRLKTGTYPAPDGHDGKMPYWKQSTVKRLLSGRT
jgi:predicted DNA-binding transcriptional regulator AlpA